MIMVAWRMRFCWAAALVLSTVLGRWTRPEDGPLALAWPAAGVAFLWLLHARRRGQRQAVDVVLLGAITGAVNALSGAPPLLAAGLGLANAAQAVVAVAVWTGGRDGRRRDLRTRADLAALVGACLAGAAVGALVGPPVTAVLTGVDPWATALAWLVRNWAGAAVVAAVMIPWLVPSGGRPTVRPSWWESAALVALLSATGGVVLVATSGRPLAFVLIAPVLWAALRQPLRGTALAVAGIAGATVVATLADRGPFAALPATERAPIAQLFLLVLVAVAFVVALYRDERLGLLEEVVQAAGRDRAQTELLQAVFDSTNDGILVVDSGGQFLLHNLSATRLLGDLPGGRSPRSWSTDFGLHTTDGSPHPPGDLPLARALRGEAVPGTDLVRRLPGQDDVVLSVSARPLPGGVGAVAAFRDATDERTAARRVQDSRDLLRSVLDGATEQAIIAADAEGTITLFSLGAQRMLGYTEAEAIGSQASLFWDPAEVAARATELGVEPGYEVFVAAAKAGHAETRHWTFTTAAGDRIAVRLTVTPIPGDTRNAVSGFVGDARDVTAQLAAERALADSELRFRLAFGNAPVGLALLDLHPDSTGTVIQANAAMEVFTGRTTAELVGAAITDVLHPEEIDGVRGMLQQLSTGQLQQCSQEQRFRRPDGEVVWGHCSASVMQPDPGTPGQLVLLVEDVTARRLAEEALTHQALHDALTGLPNRTLLSDRLDQALAGLARSHHRVGLLYLDLDGFKTVNDTAGHAAGDALLVQVARRLTAAVRPGDTVARLGGDEFAVLCPEIGSADDLRVVADRLLATVGSPVQVEDRQHVVGASIGLVVADADARTDQLLHDADQAMYESKTSGKGRVTVHRGDVETRAARTTRLLPELRTALAAGHLVVHGQPIIDLPTGAVIAVETLLRWDHPDRGLLLPDQFLDVIEATDLLLPVARIVLGASCAMAARWQQLLGDAAPAVHVNVSGRHLEEGHLLTDIDTALAATGLPPSQLVVELTETHVPVLADSLRADLDQLRSRGVRLALDDVGTGWSSLVRLTELPIDVLKVDRVFISGLGADPACDAVLRAVVGLGAALGVDVIAEGVETAAQHDLVQQAGCTTAQGFHYASAHTDVDLEVLLVSQAAQANPSHSTAVPASSGQSP